jgi:CBS-domain-containing membrane protein
MQTVPVAEVCKQSTMQAMVVDRDAPLAEAVRQFASNHDLRGIFLVDEQGQLAGVINKQDLLHWVSMLVEKPISREPMSVGQIRRLVNARRMADLAAPGSENAALRLEETLAEALQKMTYFNLSDMPVVDENNQIINDLRLSEILAYVLDNT